jgi:hypothetical protein
MKNSFYFLALSLFLLVSTSRAKIGDTIAQYDAKYGPPQFSDESNRGYLCNGLAPLIEFSNGVAVSISYRKMKHDSAGNSAAFSPEEIGQLLRENSVGWKSEYPNFVSDDGSLGAAYDTVNHILVISKR